MSKSQWRTLLYWFVRGAPSAQIAHETGLERKRTLRALTVVREAMRQANPALAADATELVADHPLTLRRPRQAMLGLYVRHGSVGVDLTADDEETWSRRGYVAVVQRGRLQRVPGHGSTRAPFGEVEAFWSFLQRNLRAKGGIRPGRLNLYLAEFVWRYNHRKLANSEQALTLLRLISAPSKWNEWDYPTLEDSSRVSVVSTPHRP